MKSIFHHAASGNDLSSVVLSQEAASRAATWRRPLHLATRAQGCRSTPTPPERPIDSARAQAGKSHPDTTVTDVFRPRSTILRRRRARFLQGSAAGIDGQREPAGATLMQGLRTAIDAGRDTDALLVFVRENYILDFDIDPYTRAVTGVRLLPRADPDGSAEPASGQSAP